MASNTDGRRARIGTTREDYLAVFIVVLNLVGIAAVLSMI